MNQKTLNENDAGLLSSKQEPIDNTPLISSRIEIKTRRHTVKTYVESTSTQGLKTLSEPEPSAFI